MVTIQAQNRTFDGIEAIVFDKDGTLANTEAYLVTLGQLRSQLLDGQVPGLGPEIQQTFGLANNCLNPEGILAIASRRESEIIAAGLIAKTGRPWIESLMIAQTAFALAAERLSPKCNYTPLLAGIPELLQSLALHPLKLAILSSDTTENVEAFIAHHQLTGIIQLGCGVAGLRSKPDPQLLLEVCSALSVAPSATLMVGDSAADIQMAIAAQVAGHIGVTWGWTTPVELPEADVQISHGSQIQVVASSLCHA